MVPDSAFISAGSRVVHCGATRSGPSHCTCSATSCGVERSSWFLIFAISASIPSSFDLTCADGAGITGDSSGWSLSAV